MGTTFVSITKTSSEREIGFWMRDSVLELWLRLLALHIDEPTAGASIAYEIRNQWLLASRFQFTGCVPHGLEDAVATDEGMQIVRSAVISLTGKLKGSPAQLDGRTLDLLNFERTFSEQVETSRLIDVGNAFLDLLDGKITWTVESTEYMPGSAPTE
jgi:hypothetical protein